MHRTLLSSALLALSSRLALAVTIPTVPVGNPGNAGDIQARGTFGAVAYEYRIGATEVTNAQYAEFLNAKAATDPLFLYSTSMNSDARGGITRSGSSGSFTYAAKPNMGDKPVNFVNWYSALRFTNWLHNGQGAGNTESGAYTLLGGTRSPSNASSITRNPDAVWFLPSEDEWYKAAYYDPTLAGGTGGYWDYATRSNSAPTVATANSVGDVGNPGANVANYNTGADWNSQDGNVTTVGSAGPLGQSYYGTSDQAGNVHEWTEWLAFGLSFRSIRGGSWFEDSTVLSASAESVTLSLNTRFDVGFRVALIPEPSSIVLATVGLLGLAVLGWRRCGRGSVATPVTR